MRRIAQARPLWKLTATAAVLWCFSAAAAESATTAAKGSQAAKAKTVSVKKSENLDASYSKELNKRYAAQDLKMAEAVKLVDAKNFAKGVELAENIREELKLEAAYTKGEVIAARVAEAEALVERLRLIWGRDRMRAAHDAYTKGNHHDALIYSTEAARISPALNEDAENMRKRCQGRGRSEKFQKLSNLNVANPDLRNLRKEAANLMAEAKVFFENKRYPQALDKIEQVYLRDPFNLEAVALAGQIYRVFFTTGYYRHRADFELQNAYTTWQWIEPVFEAPEAPKEITSQENKDSHKIMSDKLSNTILPEFSYTKGNGNARGAVELLKSYLERNKMDIKIQHSITAAEAASLGAVRLDLRNVSVADVLRYISLMSGLKYRVDSHGVHIGTSVETMYSRSYEIQPHVIAWVFTSTSGDSANNSASSEEDTSVIKDPTEIFSLE